MRCAVCRKEMEGRRHKIYCSGQCADKKYYLNNKLKIKEKNKAYYEKVKDTETYKKNKKDYYSRWYKRNKIKHIKSVTEYQRRKNAKKNNAFC